MQICGSRRGWSGARRAREGGGRHHQLVTRAAPVVEKTHAATGTLLPGGGKGRRRRCLDWRGLDVAANGRIHWEEQPCDALLWDCARIHGAAE
jgi:ectoine hydroxylase-related dioxygenase (phytanoyl-CoA dioxygenase family)